MTWTWHDDDPATALSAQNMQTHIELRLRALEVAGGGDVVEYLIGTDISLSGTALSAVANDLPKITTYGGYLNACGAIHLTGTSGYEEFNLPEELAPVAGKVFPTLHSVGGIVEMDVYLNGSIPVLALYPLTGTLTGGNFFLSPLTYLLASAAA